MASLTAVRMNSVRFRLAAGATWFKARYVASSSWTRIEGIYAEYIKRLYRISIYQRHFKELRHHFTEGVLESLHLFGEADGEAHVRGPHRPPSPDIQIGRASCRERE